MAAGKLIFVALVLVALSGAAAFAQDDQKIRVLGHFTISTGLKVDGVAFGGLSGLEFDPETKRYLAISDDRAKNGPARFYDLAIDIDKRGVSSFEITGTTRLVDADGKPYSGGTVDPEEIRRLPNGRLVWSDEGTREGGGPALTEISRDGRAVGVFALPSYYTPSSDEAQGVRPNLGHEALAVSSDGKRLVAFLENAMRQDGPVATPQAGSRARVLVYDLATREPVAEYVYDTAPIPEASPRRPPRHDNGVTGAIYTDDGRLLVLERSFALGVGITIQIFEVDVADATNVLGKAKLADVQNLKPVQKTQLLKLKTGEKGFRIDNIEGIALGPVVQGQPTLLLISDNNFRRGQINQLIVLAMLR